MCVDKPCSYFKFVFNDGSVWYWAVEIFSFTASMPKTDAPSRANGSARIPPPQPMSINRKPVNGLIRLLGVIVVGADWRSCSRTNGTRSWFNECNAAYLPVSFHQADESWRNRLTSSGSTGTLRWYWTNERRNGPERTSGSGKSNEERRSKRFTSSSDEFELALTSNWIKFEFDEAKIRSFLVAQPIGSMQRAMNLVVSRGLQPMQFS